MMRRSLLLAWFTAALLFAPPACAQGELAPETHNGSSDRLARAEAEYVALQANLFDPDTLLANADGTDAIERALREIRAKFPEVGTIGIPGSWLARTSLVIGAQFPQFSIDSFCASVEDDRSVQPERLGIAELDRVTQQFGGAYQITCRRRRSSLGPYVVANFPRLLHVPSLIRRFQATPGVRSAENNLMILGGVIPVAVSKEEEHWKVVFGKGWGDCPAGCTGREYFSFAVDSDFSVEFLGTRKEGLPPE